MVRTMTRFLRGTVRVLFALVILVAVVGGGAVAVTLAHFGRDLPDHQQLTEYVPAVGSKVYAGDSSFITEFASERRIVVPIKKIPAMVIHAFLAAEDREFYTHNGVNPWAIFRAGLTDALRFHKGQRPQGASTITQQVVRHFLLTKEVSISRKIKEAILAYRIEGQLSKDRILDIYLNEIYLGAGTYGVAAAADTYFQKPLDQLSLAQIAYLAALPKAPNNYHPIRHAQAAKARRDWVLAGMAEMGYVTQAQAQAAIAEPLGVKLRPEPEGEQIGYFAEEVRRELIGRFGEKAVYEGGLTVRTSYVGGYQTMADRAYHNGLVEYDRRHGWRGPLTHAATPQAAQTALAGMSEHPGVPSWKLAAVTAVDAGGAHIVLKNGTQGRIAFSEMSWARKALSDQRVGAGPRKPSDVVNPGDIIFVEPVAAAPAVQQAASRKGAPPPAPAVAHFALRQIPDVSGGMTVMDPKTGRVFAMVGGWDFQQSQFNRVTQAKRQPGSAFKPFVFVTALQNGFTPDSVVDDAPISIPQGPGLPPWSPSNYEGTFAGPSTLRDALIHSRNLVTARLATMVGLPAIAQTVERFDIMDRMPLYYSMALGAGETTLLRLTTAYAMLDNNGRWLLPSVIDSVQDRNGRIIYQKGVGTCAACFVVAGPRTTPDNNPLYRASGTPDGSVLPIPNAQYGASPLIYKPTKADPLVDQTADANVVSMMQGVVERGTGIAVAAVGKPIAGKTGTTSDWNDAWFVGFSPGLAAGVYVGFDQPRTLGDGETGGHVAAPIFRDFMMEALKNAPATPFNQAPGSDADKVASANNAGEKGEKWAQKKLAKQLAAAQDPASADTFGSSGDDPAAARNPDDPAPAPAIRPRSRAALDRMGPADREFLARAFPDMAQGAAAAAPPGYAPNYAPPNYAPPGYSAPSYPAPSYAAAPPSYGGRGAATAAYAPAPGYGAYGGGGAPAYSAPPAYGGGYGSAPAGYGGYGGGSSGYAGYGDAAPRYARDPAPPPRYYPPARVTGGLY